MKKSVVDCFCDYTNPFPCFAIRDFAVLNVPSTSKHVRLSGLFVFQFILRRYLCQFMFGYCQFMWDEEKKTSAE